MHLGDLIKSADKKYKKIPISGISFDSRKVEKKIFFLQLKEIKFQEVNLLMKQY